MFLNTLFVVAIFGIGYACGRRGIRFADVVSDPNKVTLDK